MRRTQDLALARLRLVAQRCTGGLGPDEAVGSDADPDADWPPPRLWVRLVSVVCVLGLAGGFVALIAAWPRTDPATLDPAALGPGIPAPGAPGAAPASAPPSPVAADADPFAGALAAPEPASSEVRWLLVHVAGDVRRPGIVRLPPGARVDDALDAAGGLRRGGKLGSTNLARPVVDGERIAVGAKSPPAAPAPGGGLPSVPAAPVDLNTATLEQLDALPGVGPVTAAKIVAWRVANGRFTVIDELAEVSGIGPATLAELRPLVRV